MRIVRTTSFLLAAGVLGGAAIAATTTAYAAAAPEQCIASTYQWPGEFGPTALTANGEPVNGAALTAAHKTLPFNTNVKVFNRATKKSVIVRINDRGPFVAGRCIDISRAAFEALGGGDQPGLLDVIVKPV